MTRASTSTHPLAAYRAEFAVFERQIYLNTCSLAPLSRRSRARVAAYLDEWDRRGAAAWYDSWWEDLARLRGSPITDDELRASIAVYNDNRQAVAELYDYRSAKPWQAPTSEVYLVLRAGLVLPPEEHTRLGRDYLAAAGAGKRAPRRPCPSTGSRTGEVSRTAPSRPWATSSIRSPGRAVRRRLDTP